MSGHSKWSQIKHKKAIADAKKGKVFGKLARAISNAARGNPDPSKNLKLKGEIERARAVNMPGENINRAVSRGGDKNAASLSEIQLELIGPGGAAVVVSAITDNSNRTINELRQLALKHGAHMAGQGAVAWMFRKVGIIRVPAGAGQDAELAAIDAGADDVSREDGDIIVTTNPESFHRVKEALGLSVASSSVELVPTTLHDVPDTKDSTNLVSLLDALDEHDDVQDVVTNANI